MTADFYASGTRRLGEKLMHHQCWFFGRDIWHPNGNLLIKYGFERFGVPEGAKGGNAYRRVTDDGREMIVWGFGMFLGDRDRGGVFLKRYDFRPFLMRQASIRLPLWRAEDLPFHHPPRTETDRAFGARMTAQLIAEILEYEKWIGPEAGKSWRGDCLAAWDNAVLTTDQVRRGWRRILTKTREYEKRNSSGIPRGGVPRHIG